MTKYILTDIDDTVLECANELEAFCIKKLKRPSLGRLVDNYHIQNIFDIDDDTAEELSHDFWNSQEFFNLKPMNCSELILPKLYNQGWRFVAISACERNDRVRDARRKNLEDVFGFPWEDVYCTHGIEKSFYLKNFEPTYWVEDHWDNCQSGAELGHTSFLINRNYNLFDREPPLFRRVNTWFEIDKLIS